jgi:hypothetical protein
MQVELSYVDGTYLGLQRKAHLSLLLCTYARKKTTQKRHKKRRKKEKGDEGKWEKERNRDECEVTVHAGGTRGVAPHVLQVGTIRR